MMSGEGASAAAAILVGAAELTFAGIELARHEYKKKKLEKHLAAIKEVNNIYDNCLKDIPVAGYTSAESVSLPPIFVLDSKDNPTTAKSIKLHDAILNDLDEAIPIYNDPHLFKYGHHILNAMAALREFHQTRLEERSWFTKGNEDDVTSSVLCYLIMMLSQHCILFEGYAVDIAYLEAIAKFVNEYASLHGDKSERFEYLTLVYSELMKAKYLLVDHSMALSLEEKVTELLPMCMHVTKRMIKAFTMLITPNECWKYIQNVNMERLSKGIIKSKYKHVHSLRQSVHNNAIHLLDSQFREWVSGCARDYLLSLTVNTGVSDQDEQELTIGGQQLKIPTFSNKELLDIQKVFVASQNVLTLKAQEKKDDSSATKEFVTVKDEIEIKDRVKTLFNFIALINKLISVQYFCMHLWNRIKQLGEIYVSNPHHCNFIFQVLDELGKKIYQNAELLLESLEKIDVSNTDAMLLSLKQKWLLDMRKMLSSIKGKISDSIKFIVEKHNKRQIDRDDKGKIDLEKDQMLRISHQIAKAYGISTKHEIISKEQSDKVMANEIKKPSTEGAAPNAVIKEEKYADVNAPGNPKIDAKDLDVILFNMNQKIEAIKQTEKPTRQSMVAYVAVYNALFAMVTKSKNLQNEKEASRQTKGQVMALLSYTVCKDTLQFLENNHQERAAQVATFAKKIKTELSDPQNISIDVHQSKHNLGKMFSRGGFFTTVSRSRANNVDKAWSELVKRL